MISLRHAACIFSFQETDGDIEALDLPSTQMQLFEAVSGEATASNVPVISTLVFSRPRLLGSVAENSSALLMAYRPCQMAGLAIAQVQPSW